MAVPKPKRLLIVRSHFQSHPSAGPAVRATEPLSPYRQVRGLLTPTILAPPAPNFSSPPLNSLGQYIGGGGGVFMLLLTCVSHLLLSVGGSQFRLL